MILRRLLKQLDGAAFQAAMRVVSLNMLSKLSTAESGTHKLATPVR